MNFAAAQAELPAACTVAADPAVTSRNAPTERVSEPLTDEAREEAIKRAGRALEAHYFHWCCTGSFAAKGDADRARLLMEALIRGRSKHQVRALEIKAGLL